MEEDSCASDLGFKDSRNLRGGNSDPKKRLNHKDSSKRSKQMSKRDQQRSGPAEDPEAIKEEFDEVNKEYQKMLERKKKQEEESKALKEKQELLEKDFISNAFGSGPKADKKKEEYQEKLKNATSAKQSKSTTVTSMQRSALLTYLQSSFK